VDLLVGQRHTRETRHMAHVVIGQLGHRISSVGALAAALRTLPRDRAPGYPGSAVEASAGVLLLAEPLGVLGRQ
ncbi:MAG TPA: hypothetical protein VM287_01095, partial [Egibacteraceae bacterium]|nr:hypothetical protein [Egibacteraceae bacterium]